MRIHTIATCLERLQNVKLKYGFVCKAYANGHVVDALSDYCFSRLLFSVGIVYHYDSFEKRVLVLTHWG